LANCALGDEVTHRDVTALGVQLRELLQVHNLVLDTERVLEAAQLRGAHVQRHLPTFEAHANGVACPGALGATACGLTLRTLTTALTGLRGVGAGDRTQVVNLEHSRTRFGRICLGRSLLSSGLLRGSVS